MLRWTTAVRSRSSFARAACPVPNSSSNASSSLSRRWSLKRCTRHAQPLLYRTSHRVRVKAVDVAATLYKTRRRRTLSPSVTTSSMSAKWIAAASKASNNCCVVASPEGRRARTLRTVLRARRAHYECAQSAMQLRHQSSACKSQVGCLRRQSVMFRTLMSSVTRSD
jgi:hypothetical protein